MFIGVLFKLIAMTNVPLVFCTANRCLSHVHRPTRYVLHEQAQRCAKRYRILSAVNTAIETNGIKVMILLRLSPLVPFSGFNLM